MTSHVKKPKVLLLSPGIIKWTDSDFGLPHLVSLGDLTVGESSPVAKGDDLLVTRPEGLCRIQKKLDPLLLDDPFILGRDLGYQVRNPVQRDME